MIPTPKFIFVPLFDVPTSTINISDIKNRRFDLLERRCPVCGIKMSSYYPYHPEDDCVYGVIYNIDRV
jgi:hypothetical protein